MTNSDFHRSAASEGLKACPFCGPGQSMVDPWFDDVSKRWAIGCGRCGASSGRSVHAEGSKEAAIKSWNTRGLTGDDAQACAVRLEARPADNSKEWTEIFPAQLEWVAKAGHQVRAIEVAAQPPAAPVETKWECMGRKQALPEPGECNWPDCGCDPHATKVIESLIEQGWQAPAHPGSSAATDGVLLNELDLLASDEWTADLATVSSIARGAAAEIRRLRAVPQGAGK